MADDGDTTETPGAAAGAEVARSLVRFLARLLDEMRLTEIEVEQSGLRVRVARQAPAVALHPPAAEGPLALATPIAGPGAADPARHPGLVTSPMVGTAYRAPEPGAKPFCEIGAAVSTGDTLLVIEAMKTLNLIPAPKSGTIAQILFEDAQPVEFGEPLMIIE